MNELSRFEESFDLEDNGCPTLCHAWTGRLTPNGYASFQVTVDGVRTNHVAHKWLWEERNGPLEDGLQLDHFYHANPHRPEANCPRHCVNLEHVRPASARENVLKGDTLAAANTALQECPKHQIPLVQYSRQRGCPKCRSEYDKERKKTQRYRDQAATQQRLRRADLSNR